MIVTKVLCFLCDKELVMGQKIVEFLNNHVHKSCLERHEQSLEEEEQEELEMEELKSVWR